MMSGTEYDEEVAGTVALNVRGAIDPPATVMLTLKASMSPFQHLDHWAGCHATTTPSMMAVESTKVGGAGTVVLASPHGTTYVDGMDIVLRFPEVAIADTVKQYDTPNRSGATSADLCDAVTLTTIAFGSVAVEATTVK